MFRPAFFLVGAIVVQTTAACDYCLVSQGLSPLDTVDGHGLRLSERYTSLNSVYDGSDEIDHPGAREEYYTTEVSAFWSPRGWLTLIGVVPFRVTHVDGHLVHGGGAHQHDDEHEHAADEDEHASGHGNDLDHDPRQRERDAQVGGDGGLGDVSLIARANVFQHHTLATTTRLALLAGIKLPTATTDQRADNGDYLDAHLQLGTGATDGLFGFSASHARGRWSAAANLLGALKGKGEAGAFDYEYGDALNYDLTARYRVSPATLGAAAHHWFLSCGFAGEARGHEHEDGFKIDDSGGHVVFVQPGAQLSLGARATLDVAVQVPIHHDLSGTQLGEDLKVFATWTLSL
jgi:hypothetical protein